MPSSQVSPEQLLERTHRLRQDFDAAGGTSVRVLERNAAGLLEAVRSSPRRGVAAAAADACAAASDAVNRAGQPGAAVRWARLGWSLADEHGADVLGCVNTVMLADGLLECGRPQSALLQLDGIRTGDPHVQVLVATRRAVAHAAAGDGYQMAAQLDHADVWLDRAAGRPPPRWAQSLGRNWLAAWRGHAAVRLGRLHLGEEPWRQVLRASPGSQRRGRAEASLGLARASFRRGALDECTAWLGMALPDLLRGASGRELRVARVLTEDVRARSPRHGTELDGRWEKR